MGLVLVGFKVVKFGAGIDEGGGSMVVFFEAVLGIFGTSQQVVRSLPINLIVFFVDVYEGLDEGVFFLVDVAINIVKIAEVESFGWG